MGGCYVNPRDMTKEDFLLLHGEQTVKPGPITESHLPVCLVYNPGFSAAAVGHKQSEIDAFNDPNDGRPKLWFNVSREDLRTVSDLASYE